MKRFLMIVLVLTVFLVIGKSREASASSTKVDDSGAGTTYSANWTTTSNAGAYGGSYKITNTSGSYMTFTFTGTSIRLISKRATDQGRADIYIDGVSQGFAEAYGNPGGSQQVIFEKLGLTNSSHTIRIECNGKQLHNSSNTYVIIDEFEYNFAPQGFEDSSSAAITYSGTWTNTSNASAYNGSYKSATAASAYAEYAFIGGSVKWISTLNSDRGRADVYIDGVLETTMDLYRPTTRYQQVVYEKTGLLNGAHKIKVVAKGDKNTASSSTLVDIDAFEYNYSANSVEDDLNPNIAYSGTWSVATDTNSYGEGLHNSTVTGSYAEYFFTGRSIRWIATTGSSMGKADVYIDGALQQTVDLYTASTKYQQSAYEKTGLSNAIHSIKIVSAGLKNASSSGYTVNVDGLGVNLKGLTKVDEAYNGITYNGTWTPFAYDSYYGGNTIYTSTTNGYAQFDFRGTTIRWIGALDSNRGQADVYIDGVLKATVDEYNADPLLQKVLFEKTGLSNGVTHTMKIVCKGTKNAASSGYIIDLDYFEIDYAGTLYGAAGTDSRYLSFGEWNTLDAPDFNSFKQIASYANQIGFNVFRIHIPWYSLQTGVSTFNYTLYDNELDYIINTLGMKAAILVELTGLYNGGSPVYFTLAELQKNNGGSYVVGQGDRAPFSWSSATAVAKANTMLNSIISRYYARYAANSILYTSPVFAQWFESEGWDNGMTDYSDAAKTAFITWCQSKYASIAALNSAWGTSYSAFSNVLPPNDYNGNQGLDWYQFKHSKLKALLATFADTIYTASSGTIKTAPQFGSVWDSSSPNRNTFAFTDLVNNARIQMVVEDDAPSYNHYWSVDQLRSSLPGKWISDETDGPWNGVADVVFQKQTIQAFAHGANLVSMANWEIEYYRFKSATWMVADAASSLLPYNVPTSYPRMDSQTVSAYNEFRNGVGGDQSTFNSKSQNGFVWVNLVTNDDLSGAGTPTPTPTPTPLTTVNDDAAGITYSGSWTYITGTSGSYNNDEHYSNTTNNYAQFTFTGTEIHLLTTKDLNRGNADIYIDGVLDSTIDLYNPTRITQIDAFTKTGLTNASHTIKVIVKGTKNTSSSSYYVIIDAFKYK